MMAQRKETTILEVAGNLATPLTVHTSKGTYTVYNSTELNGSVSVRSAEDANGNKVVVPNGNYKSHTSNGRSEYTRIYRFKTLYNNSSSSSSSGSYGNRNNGGSYGGGNYGGGQDHNGNAIVSSYNNIINLPTKSSTSTFGKWRYNCTAEEGSYCEIMEIVNVGSNKCYIIKEQFFMDSEMQQDLGGQSNSYEGVILSNGSIEYEYRIPIPAGNYIRIVKHHLILRNGMITDNCTSYSQYYSDSSWTSPTYADKKSSSTFDYYCIGN